MSLAEQLEAELLRSKARGESSVSSAVLAERLGVSEDQLLPFLQRWKAEGRLSNDVSTTSGHHSVQPQGNVSGPSASAQTVHGSAFNQHGAHNTQNVYQSPVVQLPLEAGPSDAAMMLRQLFPNPGEKARGVLRQEAECFIAWLGHLQLPERPSAEEFLTWLRHAEEATKPLARALAAAISHVPEDIVEQELEGLLQEAVKTLHLHVPLGNFIQVSYQVYPLAILAYTVAIVSSSTKRLLPLRALNIVYVTAAPGRKIVWLYLLHYLNELSRSSAFPTSTAVVPTQNRILDLLVGEKGWLRDELARYGADKAGIVGEAVLAYLIHDADNIYFQTWESSVYLGEYLWKGDEIRSHFARVFQSTDTWDEIVTNNPRVLYGHFLVNAERRNSSWSG